MFDKYELGTILRSLSRSNEDMRNSKYVGPGDQHLVKCEALEDKVKKLLDPDARAFLQDAEPKRESIRPDADGSFTITKEEK